MEVISQAPQPTIKCYRSIINGKASNYCYMGFSPNSIYESGRNLHSYNFERSLENFGGSFSFTIKEDTEKATRKQSYITLNMMLLSSKQQMTPGKRLTLKMLKSTLT